MTSSPTGQSRIKLATLHKGMGVRRDNLRSFLGEWPVWWHLHTEDDATVRAHLTCWVNEMLDGLASSQHRTIGQVAPARPGRVISIRAAQAHSPRNGRRDGRGPGRNAA